MPTPAAAPISLSQVRTELGASGAISLAQASVRTLAGIPTGSINLLSLLNKSAGAVVASGSSSVEDTTISPADAAVEMTFSSDGTISGTPSFIGANKWWSAAPVVGIGSSYWYMVVLNNGTAPTGVTFGTWVNNVNFSLSALVTSNAGSAKNCTVTVSISATNGGAVLGTFTANLYAIVEI